MCREDHASSPANGAESFPYPVQYFSCKDFQTEDTEKFFREKVLSWTEMGLVVGSVTGETGIPGLKLDFNNGIRLQVPKGNFHVIIRDEDSRMVFYDMDVSEKILVSIEKYFIRYGVEVFLDGNMIFSHNFDPTGQRVHFVFCSRLLGDAMALAPYLHPFIEKYGVTASYFSVEYLRDIINRIYPKLPYSGSVPEDCYATFYLTAGRNDPSKSPLDGRMVPLWHMGRFELGLADFAKPLPWAKREPEISKPYVCIGIQASHPCKCWIYPGGWDKVVGYLKGLGYRVLCIDKERSVHKDGFEVDMPEGAEDFTGAFPLTERADLLSHADFFIGLSSGLSWLAWTVGCPVVMIGGFSLYWYEFPEAYRVFNPLACTGCFTDPRTSFGDPCDPKNGGDPLKQLECSKTITPAMVIREVDRLRKEHGLK